MCSMAPLDADEIRWRGRLGLSKNSGPPQNNLKTLNEKIGKMRLFGIVFGHFEALIGSYMCGVASLDVDEMDEEADLVLVGV